MPGQLDPYTCGLHNLCSHQHCPVRSDHCTSRRHTRHIPRQTLRVCQRRLHISRWHSWYTQIRPSVRWHPGHTCLEHSFYMHWPRDLYLPDRCICPFHTQCMPADRPGWSTFPFHNHHRTPVQQCPGTYRQHSSCSRLLRLAQLRPGICQQRSLCSPFRDLVPSGRCICQCHSLCTKTALPGQSTFPLRNHRSLLRRLALFVPGTYRPHSPCSRSPRPGLPGRCICRCRRACSLSVLLDLNIVLLHNCRTPAGPPSLDTCQRHSCRMPPVRMHPGTGRLCIPCSLLLRLAQLRPGICQQRSPCSPSRDLVPSGRYIFQFHSLCMKTALPGQSTCPLRNHRSLLRRLARFVPGTYRPHSPCSRSPRPGLPGRCICRFRRACSLSVLLDLNIVPLHNCRTTPGQLGRGTGRPRSPCNLIQRLAPLRPGTYRRHSPCRLTRRLVQSGHCTCRFRSFCTTFVPLRQSMCLLRNHHRKPVRLRPGTGRPRSPCSLIRRLVQLRPGTCQQRSLCNPSPRHCQKTSQGTCRFHSSYRPSEQSGQSIALRDMVRTMTVQPEPGMCRPRIPHTRFLLSAQRCCALCPPRTLYSRRPHPGRPGRCICLFRSPCSHWRHPARLRQGMFPLRNRCTKSVQWCLGTVPPHNLCTRHLMSVQPECRTCRPRNPYNRTRRLVPTHRGTFRPHNPCTPPVLLGQSTYPCHMQRMR